MEGSKFSRYRGTFCIFLNQGLDPRIGGVREVGGGIENFTLFRREKAGLSKENVLAAREVGVEFEPVPGEGVGMENFRDWACSRLRRTNIETTNKVPSCKISPTELNEMKGVNVLQNKLLAEADELCQDPAFRRAVWRHGPGRRH